MSLKIENGFVRIDLSWKDFKAIALESKLLPLQVYEEVDQYINFCLDSAILYINYIDKDKVSESDLKKISQQENDDDKKDLEDNYLSSANKVIK